MSTLEIKDLHVTVDTEDGAKEILKGVTLTINDGETHAIMGPNGSGKSTLAYSIAGHPKYTVTGGTVTLDGAGRPRDDRRRARPRRALPRHAVPRRGPRRLGVQLPAHREDRHRRRGAQAAHLGQGRQRRARAAQPRPDVRPAHGQRGLLRRREEAPRDRPARAAEPEGRDPRRDRLRPRHRRAQGRLRGRQPLPRAGRQGRAADHALHAHPALHQPDFVHVFVDGRIAEQGGPELADQLEAEGYDKYTKALRSERPRRSRTATTTRRTTRVHHGRPAARPGA